MKKSTVGFDRDALLMLEDQGMKLSATEYAIAHLVIPTTPRRSKVRYANWLDVGLFVAFVVCVGLFVALTLLW